MSSYNRVTLVGNLTRQPELRKTKTGASVTDLGLALNRIWNTENGERQEETTFVEVTVWGRAAENAAQYLQKGRSVLVEGRLQMETWQDKQTGQERHRLKVVADALQFLGAVHESGTSDRETDSTGRRGDLEREEERGAAPRRGDSGVSRRSEERGTGRRESR
ncbi:MAG: single-stranded DNA-binding protein [Verrucomicrobiae bacterium]|nr:single-stranded DNA-binding protein [Verrucomicrobiae bacterium]